MKTIKIWFTDFYKGFDPKDNYFYSLLSEFYSIELNKNDPDYLIYSCYGNDFLNYDCIRIFYTGENLIPDFNLCDYAIGFHYIDFGERYLRFPNFVLFKEQFDQLINSKKEKTDAEKKEHFCNFIYANSKADPVRDEFFQLLSDYKKVASPGSHLNNMKFDIGDRYGKDWMYTKLDFQSRCKFSLAFENSSAVGYTTEKIMHAFIANTIPVYWGNPKISMDFNQEAFINCHNFKSFEAVIDRIKEIDQNDELYASILSAPPFPGNQIPEQFRSKRLLEFFKIIFDQDLKEAKRRPSYGTTLKYENNIKAMVKVSSKVKGLLGIFK